MNLYKISIIGSPLEPFTYESSHHITNGSLVSVEFNKRIKDGVVVSKSCEVDFKTSEILEVRDSFYSEKQLKLAGFISSYYVCSLGDAFNLMTPFIASNKFEVPSEPEKYDGISASNKFENLTSVPRTCSGLESSLQLSPKQKKALEFLKKHKVSLLFGDTGSGKTEVYMKYFEEVLRENKRVIFLMPEISLTPQMATRLEEYFGDSFVMWHSKLTPLQKKKAMQKIKNGEAKIIAGARSALFLPIEDLGLIVVDEEHDDSYKSSSRPRYNARDLSIYMGQLYDVAVVLGSATPSLSSYVKFPHARLKGGHFNSNKEFIYEKAPESLSPLILDNLKATLEKNEQSIVFIPTRANFKYLICGDCGHTFKCAFCSVGLSIHTNSRAMKCHYCNFTQAIPQVCPECHSPHLVSSRLGTAEAVKNISEAFPEANVAQFDRDAITTANKLKRALKKFNDKESDILVGTQMLSKGHDYHGVTLAVVLGMDNMLNMSDYRAREKALSSLTQVAGRSGRAQDAKVIVQTFNEEFFKNYIDKYEDFLEDEKFFREALYPPYKKLCRILFAHKNGIKASEAMHEMKDKLLKFRNIEIVGAKKCAIEKVANKYRYEILLRAQKSTDIIKAVRNSMVALAEVDMDPIEFG